MFCYSGSWSKIEDASITLLLTDQKPSIDEVCQLLRANAEVLRLWSDFSDFVKNLRVAFTWIAPSLLLRARKKGFKTFRWGR